MSSVVYVYNITITIKCQYMFVYAVDIEPIRCVYEGRPSGPSTPVSVINLFTVVIYIVML